MLPRLLPLPLASALPTRAVGRLLRWSRESHQGALRNAMVASTALAQRRAEREEVEDYLASSGSADHAARAARG